MSADTIGGLNLTPDELTDFANRMRAKAQQEHQDARRWMNRALLAESRLSILEADKENHV